MHFIETRIKGVFIIEPERVEDERGFFARTFCERELEARGLQTRFVQCSISFNRKKGTLRGMHYQAAPHEEAKLVRCTSGAICDVTLDLRPKSSTFRQWVAVDLTARNRKAVYIPKGVAHGLQTLDDDTEVFYQISEFYDAASQRGVRWDDPAFGIQWPLPVTVMSARDRGYPLAGSSKQGAVSRERG
jgi:dTDP-4-dehydrorhamnose 3,5-epimerase